MDCEADPGQHVRKKQQCAFMDLEKHLIADDRAPREMAS